MQYQQYGKDGPEVSRLGFGAMRLPRFDENDNNSVDMEKSERVILAALEAGVNFIDSHHMYHGGLSEVAVGKALRRWKGHRVYTQTKTPWYMDAPEDRFKARLHEALEKMGVETIDYLFHHSMNMDMWKAKGKDFIKFTDWAMTEGLIQHRGFSSHDTPENIKKFVDTGEFSAMLVSYNWLNPEVKDAIAYAADKGMGVSIMNPLGGGTLAIDTDEIMQLVPGTASSVEVAMRHVLATPGVCTALSGMNEISQVEENVAIASRETALSGKQWDGMMAQLKDIDVKASKVCTGCGYCMPCEEGVDIPANFRLYNQATLLGNVAASKKSYARLVGDGSGDKSAAACAKCGKCQEKCPIDVAISERLDKVQALLGSA
jgi:predicted aldo/keto reductase-like oxidoreductase